MDNYTAEWGGDYFALNAHGWAVNHGTRRELEEWIAAYWSTAGFTIVSREDYTNPAQAAKEDK